MTTVKGSGKDNSENPGPIKCDYKYAKCAKGFDSLKAMQRHKRYAEDHYYCRKCDVDSEDWEALTQHKVSLMDEFYRNRKYEEPDASPKHVTCEFCGEDFGSFGGRKAHKEQLHQADQSINCPGCQALFTKASNAIAHLEQGNCPEISAWEFKASIQHKYILKEINKDVGAFNERLAAYRAYTFQLEKPGLVAITEGSDADDDDVGGGVALLDEDDAEQKEGYVPLEPEIDLMDRQLPLTRSNLERWPRLPGLTESIRSMSLKSGAPSATGTDTGASDITSRRGGKKVLTESYAESYPALTSPTEAMSSAGDDDEDAVSDVTAVDSPRSMAWATGNTSKALFKGAKMTPDQSAIAKRNGEESVAENSKSLLKTRFYDPSSDEYDPDLFFNHMVGAYCCPFQECDFKGCKFDVPADLEAHLHHAHLRIQFVCTTCYKRFTSATAQMAHMESTGRCRVKESKNFKDLLKEITGGFLDAKRLAQPFIHTNQKALVKAGQQVADGVKSVEYKAKLPGQT